MSATRVFDEFAKSARLGKDRLNHFFKTCNKEQLHEEVLLLITEDPEKKKAEHIERDLAYVQDVLRLLIELNCLKALEFLASFVYPIVTLDMLRYVVDIQNFGVLTILLGAYQGDLYFKILDLLVPTLRVEDPNEYAAMKQDQRDLETMRIKLAKLKSPVEPVAPEQVVLVAADDALNERADVNEDQIAHEPMLDNLVASEVQTVQPSTFERLVEERHLDLLQAFVKNELAQQRTLLPTAFMLFAAQQGWMPVIQLLVRCGVQPSEESVQAAAASENFEVLEFLLEQVKDSRGYPGFLFGAVRSLVLDSFHNLNLLLRKKYLETGANILDIKMEKIAAARSRAENLEKENCEGLRSHLLEFLSEQQAIRIQEIQKIHYEAERSLERIGEQVSILESTFDSQLEAVYQVRADGKINRVAITNVLDQIRESEGRALAEKTRVQEQKSSDIAALETRVGKKIAGVTASYESQIKEIADRIQADLLFKIQTIEDQSKRVFIPIQSQGTWVIGDLLESYIQRNWNVSQVDAQKHRSFLLQTLYEDIQKDLEGPRSLLVFDLLRFVLAYGLPHTQNFLLDTRVLAHPLCKELVTDCAKSGAVGVITTILKKAKEQGCYSEFLALVTTSLSIPTFACFAQLIHTKQLDLIEFYQNSPNAARDLTRFIQEEIAQNSYRLMKMMHFSLQNNLLTILDLLLKSGVPADCDRGQMITLASELMNMPALSLLLKSCKSVPHYSELLRQSARALKILNFSDLALLGGPERQDTELFKMYVSLVMDCDLRVDWLNSLNLGQLVKAYDQDFILFCLHAVSSDGLRQAISVWMNTSRQSLIDYLVHLIQTHQGETLKLLLDHGAPSYISNNRAVIVAAEFNNTEALALLQEHGVDLRAHQDQALMAAATAGKSHAVIWMLQQQVFKTFPINYDHLLIAAARCGDKDIALIALARKARFDAQYNAPLQTAVVKGALAIIQLLRDEGALLGQGDLLIQAAQAGQRKSVDWLLEEDRKKILKTQYQKALSAASGIGHLDIIHLLLKHGAHVDQFALTAAVLGNHREVYDFFIQDGNISVRNLDHEAVFLEMLKKGYQDLWIILAQDLAKTWCALGGYHQSIETHWRDDDRKLGHLAGRFLDLENVKKMVVFAMNMNIGGVHHLYQAHFMVGLFMGTIVGGKIEALRFLITEHAISLKSWVGVITSPFLDSVVALGQFEIFNLLRAATHNGAQLWNFGLTGVYDDDSLDPCIGARTRIEFLISQAISRFDCAGFAFLMALKQTALNPTSIVGANPMTQIRLLQYALHHAQYETNKIPLLLLGFWLMQGIPQERLEQEFSARNLRELRSVGEYLKNGKTTVVILENCTPQGLQPVFCDEDIAERIVFMCADGSGGADVWREGILPFLMVGRPDANKSYYARSALVGHKGPIERLQPLANFMDSEAVQKAWNKPEIFAFSHVVALGRCYESLSHCITRYRGLQSAKDAQQFFLGSDHPMATLNNMLLRICYYLHHAQRFTLKLGKIRAGVRDIIASLGSHPDQQNDDSTLPLKQCLDVIQERLDSLPRRRMASVFGDAVLTVNPLELEASI